MAEYQVLFTLDGVRDVERFGRPQVEGDRLQMTFPVAHADSEEAAEVEGRRMWDEMCESGYVDRAWEVVDVVVLRPLTATEEES